MQLNLIILRLLKYFPEFSTVNMAGGKLCLLSIIISVLTVTFSLEATSISQGQRLNGCLSGQICEPQCPSTCVRVLCNKTSSVCSEGCINGFYGDICNDKCAANCKDQRCLRGTGRCIKCVSGWYGPHCELECSYCPGGDSCDQETGDCNDKSRIIHTKMLPALLGTVCSVVVIAVVVLILYIKCRYKDGGNQREGTDICKRMSDSREPDSIRIVLLGKSGCGKSETGNTVVGHNVFQANIIEDSVTQRCNNAHGKLLGQKVLITDTPGILEFLDKKPEIARFVDLTLPGPHILLFVLRVDNLTQEDVESLNKLKRQFGGAVEEHLVVVFTHVNELKKRKTTEEQYLQTAKNVIPMLERFDERCVFLENDPNYPLKEKENQLKQLLTVIQNVRMKNGGNCYLNDIYKKKLKENYKRRIRTCRREEDHSFNTATK